VKKAALALAAAWLLSSTAASATTFTQTSPTGGALPAGVTPVGGIVADLTGTNGTRVVSQLSASSLYEGFSGAGNNPLLIGTQTGFSAAILSAFGGGLSAASFRITLEDGDSAPGDFDDGTDNRLRVDGLDLGFWSSVTTERTTDDGLTVLSSAGLGFANGILSTGWFSTTDPVLLAALFGNLGDGSLSYFVDDVDPNDNFYDFTQGVAGGLINVGQGPVITPPNGAVPEPGTWAMMLLGFGIIGRAMRNRRRQAAIAIA
jgi:hypothetical protein